MGLKKNKPTTPSRRHTVLNDNKDITKKKPEKSLTKRVKYNAGRGSDGKITVRHRGGRVKRRYRIIDFKRDKLEVPAKVAAKEYDPYRSANLLLLHYEDGEKRYILAPEGVEVGDTVVAGDDVPIRKGNAVPLKKVPSGIRVHNIQLDRKSNAQICRSAGSSAQVMGGDEGYVQIKMPSGEIRLVAENNYATIGSVGNKEHAHRKLGKAGRKRYLGFRPTVRGQAMAGNDHPHGGGEAKDRVGGQRKTVYGKRTDVKTRKRKKSDKYIVKSRHKK